VSARRWAAVALLLAGSAAQAQVPGATARAVFATGCFWCTESDFEKLDGVVSAVSGYIGGKVQNPTYEQVGSGLTGHTEAVEVTYDPAKISYDALLDEFWRTHDPFNMAGQFCDRGPQYRPAIFVLDDAQKKSAEASKARAQARFAQPLLTPIEPASRFWPAESYHQDYYKTNTLRYRYYRSGCGRDARLAEIRKQAKP
jgi:peptide-methionine (S)-S-oxide reductase